MSGELSFAGLAPTVFSPLLCDIFGFKSSLPDFLNVKKIHGYRKGKFLATKGFSLVEVVISLGIFAVLILAVVALLTPTLRSVRETTDADLIPRIPSLVRGELMANPALWRDWEPSGPNDILLFYIDQDGLLLRPAQVVNGADPLDYRNRFYGVVLRPGRDPDGDPFTFDPQDTTRTYSIQLYWPASRLLGPRPDGTLQGLPLDGSTAEVARLNQRFFQLSLRR